jgi:hypothetical protein
MPTQLLQGGIGEVSYERLELVVVIDEGRLAAAVRQGCNTSGSPKQSKQAGYGCVPHLEPLGDVGVGAEAQAVGVNNTAAQVLIECSRHGDLPLVPINCAPERQPQPR